jgi:glycosyltransferase involved in cell wall biosynthesis
MSEAATDRPLVSVVVPVFNGERYLRESLDSIVGQTYPRTEVLVMDDTSTDATRGIIESYGDRVRAYRQPVNRGIYGNTNDGIAMASGQYIGVYHADDIYDPHIVEHELAFLERYPEAGAVFCQDIFIDREGREFGRLTLPTEIRGGQPLDFPVIFNGILTHRNRFLPCPSAMVRASVYRDVGTYRGEYGIAADLEMWVRIARKHAIAILEEYLFRYRSGHQNSSQQYFHLRTEPEGYFRIMDECLSAGGNAVATSASLRAYAAHRAEDRLMRVISLYILGRRGAALELLREVRPMHILRSGRVQRGRLLVLLALLHGLVRVPRVRVVADLFYHRWHGKGRAPSAARA